MAGATPDIEVTILSQNVAADARVVERTLLVVCWSTHTAAVAVTFNTLIA